MYFELDPPVGFQHRSRLGLRRLAQFLFDLEMGLLHLDCATSGGVCTQGLLVPIPN
jgi:hypothetical protein